MQESVPVPSKKKTSTLWNIIKMVIALVLVGFVLSKTDLGQIAGLRERILFPWLVAGLLLYLLLTVLKALQYYLLFGRQVTYPSVLNIVVVQNAVSNFIATGAGIASYLALFRVEHRVKLSSAAVTFILTKVGDLVSIWLFLLVSGLWIWSQIDALRGVVVLLLVGMGLVLVVFFVTVFFRQRFVALLHWALEKLHLDQVSLIAKGLGVLQELAEQEHALVLRMVRLGIVYSLIYMFVTMAWVYTTLATFGIFIPVVQVVFVNVFMQLISYFPIQILGGLGVTEATYLYLYGFLGHPESELAAALIGFRVLFYLMNLVVLLYLPLHAFFLNGKKEINHEKV